MLLKQFPTYYVRKLCEPLYGTSRNITCDNWFTSIEIINRMKKENISIVGTIRKNKRQIPPSFKSVPLDKTVAQFCYSEGKTLVSYNPKKKK